LDFYLHTIEVFSVKPSDSTFCGGGIIVCDGGFAFLVSSFSVLVDPDLGLSSSFVVLNNTD